MIRAVVRWVADTENNPLRLDAVHQGDARQYLTLSRIHDHHVHARLIVAGLATLPLLITSIGVAVAGPPWAPWALLAAAVGVFGLAGGRADKPLLTPARVTARARKLSADIVARAFTVAGLAKPDDPIAFARPIAREGEGWRAVIDLPFGKTFSDAMRAREKLASGLDLAETQVFLDRDRSSSRRVSLWVAERDPLAVGVGKFPLLKTNRPVDFWAPFPLGLDERGNPVTVSLVFASLLIGSVPRQGKTFTARLFALAAALDPYVRVYVFDGKGSPDWRDFAKVAYRCGFGTAIRAGVDPTEEFLAALYELKTDVEDRYDRISALPRSVCPEGKLTPQIARNPKYRLPVTLVMVDEVQEYLAHPEHGKQILELLTYLVRVAPAVGVSVECATQKPDDKALPSQLRDQHQGRFCLRVGSWQVSEVILGAGSYGEGLDASTLLPSHKGVGILKGLDDTASIVRAYFADGDDVDKGLDKARGFREAAGTLDGQAAGQASAAPAWSILDDLLDVIGTGEPKIWSETVLARLVEARPELYTGWGPDQLAAALKPYGVPVGRQVWGQTPDGTGANRRGLHRADITKAITARDRKRGEKPPA